MKQNEHQSLASASNHSDSERPKYLFEAVDAYQMVEEKDQFLRFLATWKDQNLTDQQAVEQLKLLTAKATAAPDAQSAHQMQMELLEYADKVVEKIIDSNRASFEHTLSFFQNRPLNLE